MDGKYLKEKVILNKKKKIYIEFIAYDNNNEIIIRYNDPKNIHTKDNKTYLDFHITRLSSVINIKNGNPFTIMNNIEFSFADRNLKKRRLELTLNEGNVEIIIKKSYIKNDIITSKFNDKESDIRKALSKFLVTDMTVYEYNLLENIFNDFNTFSKEYILYNIATMNQEEYKKISKELLVETRYIDRVKIINILRHNGIFNLDKYTMKMFLVGAGSLTARSNIGQILSILNKHDIITVKDFTDKLMTHSCEELELSTARQHIIFKTIGPLISRYTEFVSFKQ